MKSEPRLRNRVSSLRLLTCVHAQSLSCIWLFSTPWTVDHKAPWTRGFPRLHKKRERGRTRPNTYLNGNSSWIRDFRVKGQCRKLLEDEDGFFKQLTNCTNREGKDGRKSQNTTRRNLEVIFYTPRVGKKFKSTIKASVCKYVEEWNFNTLLVGV